MDKILKIFLIFIFSFDLNYRMCLCLTDSEMHPAPHQFSKSRVKRFTHDQTQDSTEYWNILAQTTLRDYLTKRVNTNIAKNVIFFLGDGMSLPTITASRIYMGQKSGKSGEETQMSFEKFPYVGLAKTYCIDKQVADSACTATAYLCGIKANSGTIGVNGNVQFNDCQTGREKENHVNSIADWAIKSGKDAGIVTTTRITHASPAGTYAHVASRDWESDNDTLINKVDPAVCQDIASQLILNSPGKDFKVILGGGRAKFIPKSETDEEGEFGQRLDKVNLIKEWIKQKGNEGKYVWDKKGLNAIDYNKTNYILGLFEPDHLKFNLDMNHETKPTLAELTTTAIKVLQRGRNGYFLFVEGGRIDHAHHDTKAQKALDETVEFAKAIETAVQLTNEDDTLIIVTADHAHTMSISGYSDRGENILGLNTEKSDVDHHPYTTLSYANGPGYRENLQAVRAILTNEIIENIDYEYPTLLPLDYETHGGDDVPVFAQGPWSHLFTGLYEQNLIPHMLAYASCVGDGLTACKNKLTSPSCS